MGVRDWGLGVRDSGFRELGTSDPDLGVGGCGSDVVVVIQLLNHHSPRLKIAFRSA